MKRRIPRKAYSSREFWKPTVFGPKNLMRLYGTFPKIAWFKTSSRTPIGLRHGSIPFRT